MTYIYYRCGPCRNFTPLLVNAYRRVQNSGKKFEIIFVSSDEDETAFKRYLSAMPWYAVPYKETETRLKLSKEFDIEGIPALLLFDPAGNMISDEGTDLIMQGKINDLTKCYNIKL